MVEVTAGLKIGIHRYYPVDEDGKVLYLKPFAYVHELRKYVAEVGNEIPTTVTPILGKELSKNWSSYSDYKVVRYPDGRGGRRLGSGHPRRPEERHRMKLTDRAFNLMNIKYGVYLNSTKSKPLSKGEFLAVLIPTEPSEELLGKLEKHLSSDPSTSKQVAMLQSDYKKLCNLKTVISDRLGEPVTDGNLVYALVLIGRAPS